MNDPLAFSSEIRQLDFRPGLSPRKLPIRIVRFAGTTWRRVGSPEQASHDEIVVARSGVPRAITPSQGNNADVCRD
jgi:hypothetical protein